MMPILTSQLSLNLKCDRQFLLTVLNVKRSHLLSFLYMGDRSNLVSSNERLYCLNYCLQAIALLNIKVIFKKFITHFGLYLTLTEIKSDWSLL